MDFPQQENKRYHALEAILECELGYRVFVSETTQYWKPTLEIVLIDDDKQSGWFFQTMYGVPIETISYEGIIGKLKYAKDNGLLVWEKI